VTVGWFDAWIEGGDDGGAERPPDEHSPSAKGKAGRKAERKAKARERAETIALNVIRPCPACGGGRRVRWEDLVERPVKQIAGGVVQEQIGVRSVECPACGFVAFQVPLWSLMPPPKDEAIGA
jgi:hypothetical protein